MATHRTIVLSDLHLGPPGPLTIFREQQALCGFLERLTQEHSPLELILAGDTFDYLALPGYAGFDSMRAAERTLAILHHNKAVVTALGRLAARHRLTILSGNHDPEVLLPHVRELLSRELGAAIGVEEVLVPGPGEHPAVFGRWVAEHHVAVVHGDRWDPQNAINREALLRDGSISLPLGSRLVIEILAHLQPQRRWIYELKPELPTVLPLLMYLEPQRTWMFLQEKYGLTLQMFGGLLAGCMRTGPLFGDGAHESLETDMGTQLAQVLAAGLLEEDKSDRALLQAALLSRLRHGAPSIGTLAEHAGVARLLLRTWLRSVRNVQRFGNLDSPDGIREAAARYLSVHYVLAGHTHGARYLDSNNGLPVYINTGTWVPIGTLPEGPIREVLDQLDEGGPWPAEAPRTFAVIEEDPLSVWLGHCDGDGTPRRLNP